VRLKARPCITFSFEGGQVTEREIGALIAVAKEGSQKDAARVLGISLPVLHRRLARAENKVGEPLVVTDNRGTYLSDIGRDVIHAYDEFTRRTRPATNPVVACTPITRPRVHQALSRIERERRRVAVMVSDDETNVRLFIAGLVDLMILDDPVFAYETFREHLVKEIGQDSLLWMDRGEEFALFRYGPQRIGFDYLKEQDIPHKVVRFISESDSLLDSRLSFFINESLSLRKGLTRRSISTKIITEYSILAVVHEDSEQKVQGVLNELTRNR
jgi:molybdenum-dependent DNA-binding transcriptional regulator ModE